ALAEIGASLAPVGAIQLYGCDVAQGASGQQFINDFSTFAGGVQVDAATHIVGSASFGGSWTLDAVSDSGAGPAPAGVAAPSGDVSSSALVTPTSVVTPFTPDALANFQNQLAVPVTTEIWFVTNGASANTNSLGETDNVSGANTASNTHTLFQAGT